MRKILSIIIIAILIISLTACEDSSQMLQGSADLSDAPTVSRSGPLASSGGPAAVTGSEILKTNAGRDGTQIVWYGEQNWYVIGYDGEGSAAAAEKVVTLLHVTADEQTPFSEVPGNTYRGSALENYLESMLAEGTRAVFSTSEQNAVVSRKLEGGSANHGEDGYDDNKVKGESVTVPLWPLSAAEESEMPSSIGTVGIGSSWWLRSPGDTDSDVQVANGDGTVSSKGTDATQSTGIRPAFDLDMDAIVLTTAAEGGKASGAAGPDALSPVGTNASGEWKLTLKDDGSIEGLSGHSGFAVGSVSTCDGKTLRIDYSGASAGTNEYISALIRSGNGTVTYYGRLKGSNASSGTVTVDVDGILTDGDTLCLFNEQYNGDRKTDYASSLKEIKIPSDADHVWKDATCTEPKTCTVCGITEGDPLGHEWTEATCTEPKTCSVCGATEGAPLGHDWVTVSCTEPRTCSVCGETESEAPGHVWIDATCTEPKTCSVCGATEGDPLGHVWTDATCTEPKTCSVCHATEGDPLGHTPGQEVRENEKAPTCEEKGSYDSVVTCDVCHAELTRETKEIPELGHSWDDGAITKEATCEEKGIKTYTCKNDSSHTKTEDIDPIGHNWDDGRITKEAACEEKGVKTYTCRNDSSHTKTEDVEPIGHNWDNGRITKEATCEEKGVKTYTCRNDSSHTKTEDIDPIGHNWDNGKITKEATCEEKGIKTYTCKNDSSHTKTEDIEPIGHSWDDGKITKEATCEEKGEKTYTCKNDSSHTQKEEIEPLGHDWGEWKVVKEPTAEAKGERERACKRCEKKETEELDVLKGYKVTFNTNGGSEIAVQTVVENKTVPKPKDPEKDGFTFTGWYADSECKTPYDFSKAVTSDLTIYAGWKEKEKPVSYTIVEGADGTWEKGSGKSYTIRIRRAENDEKCFDHYKETLVDGKAENVYAASGSTVIILSPDSLEKLTVGSHTITVRFDDGEAVAYLTIKEAVAPVDPDKRDEPDVPDDSDEKKDPDEPVTPEEPEDQDEPVVPDEPPVPDEADDSVIPDEPDNSGTPDGKRGGSSPLLWLIAIPVVLVGGGAGFYLGRRRGRK